MFDAPSVQKLSATGGAPSADGPASVRTGRGQVRAGAAGGLFGRDAGGPGLFGRDPGGPGLFGRDAELAAIGRLTAAAAAGCGGALVLSAAPGEGRTALLRATAAAAQGWTVLTASGCTEERAVPYAGLQRLLTAVRGGLAELEPAQRAALSGGMAGAGSDRLALGLATLNLLASAARVRPVLCLLDDAHLLDPPSWQAITFAVRRAGGERLAVIATVPVGVETAGLPVRRLRLLDPAAARQLLARRAPELAEEVAAAVTELAGGNPAALIDLADALTPEQRRGYAPPPETLPPGSMLRRRYRAELDALPAVTRDLLLLAAAPPQAPPADILAAALHTATREAPAGHTLDRDDKASGSRTLDRDKAGDSRAFGRDDKAGDGHTLDRDDKAGEELGCLDAAGDGLGGFEPAERAGLVTLTGDGVRFASPLLRACVYAEAPASRRRAAHAALAQAAAERGAHLPELLHRASATTGPHSALARQLTRIAGTAEPAVAAEAHRYAAALCAEPSEQGRALLGAARSAWLAGRPHDAGLLIRRIPAAAGAARVRARGLTAEMLLPEGRPGARELLLDVAADLVDSDTAAALDALALAGEAAAAPGEQGRYAGLARRVVARRRGDEPPAMTLAFHHVAGLAGLADGDEPGAFARFRRALDVADRVTEPVPLIRAATAGILVGDARRAAALAGRAAVLARDSGSAVLVPRALELAAVAGMASGDYNAANTAAMDGAAVARGTGQPVLAGAHFGLLAVLAALVGDRDTTLSRIEAAGGGPARAHSGWALALLDLVDGRFDAATERLISVVTAPPGYGSALLQVAVVPHLLEAAAQSDTRVPDASLGLEAVATGFDRWTGRTGQPTWLALRDRCRALRATDAEAAEIHFGESLGHAGEAGFPRAHTELLYGRLLRRRRRHVEARTHLRRAAETFRLLDAEPWAEQSVRELRAAGERIEQQVTVPTGPPLTAQQERIATLVAGGATNREVAQELHLSPRTVDHHLRNVFARLGVRSRTEMARLLNSR
ncbi:helix-turn-helix domain-containing protein [Actinoplanes aureus]|uniref:AAA family ATPase n=1 Tax=Actinoplanes aureus TaxID=2792083 RepID=A0A931CA24_9ACTN|nr:helix-turn-helix transcriptional regulator [Actinoplanes aureus]MBG0562293.1 AAA family ATPase [Actinoplanes aureus]